MKNVRGILSINLLVLSALVVLAGQAHALSISPGSELYSGLTGVSSHNQNDIDDWLETTFGPDLVEFYKNDVDDGESGSLLGSYETTYNDGSDPTGATIGYMGGPFITDAYLLVKDGNHSPYWYLFDLTEAGLGWDGMEDLVLSNFWPGRGAISHVALYGSATPVPEPATLLLIGTGLVGLAGVSRKKFLKKS